MTSAATYTVSASSTFTEARARVVMGKVLADLTVLASTGLKDLNILRTWHEDISFAVQHNGVEKFQLKLETPSGQALALDYIVSDDGSLSEDSDSGGVDFFALPRETKVNVVLRYREGSPNIEKVRAYLRGRGWTASGTFVEGEARRDRAYSKDNFGLVRSQIGTWP